MNKRNRVVTMLILSVCLSAGCVHRASVSVPAIPTAEQFLAEPLPTQTAAAPWPDSAAQHFHSGDEVPASWWRLYRCPNLDRLIEQSLQRNPTLAAAQAALRQAREIRTALHGDLRYPGVDAAASAGRKKTSGAESGANNDTVFNVYTASLMVTYSPDLFGADRNRIEAADAQIEYVRFQEAATYLSLTAHIVTAAITEASLRAQIDTLSDIIELQEKSLSLRQQQFQLGAASNAPVLTQKNLLAQTRAQLPALRRQLSEIRHRLAILSGVPPEQSAALPVFSLDTVHLPESLPVSLPSELTRQRPDVRAAEALLRQAAANIGVAAAAQYPHLTLSGTYAYQATDLSDLFSGSAVWELSAGLLQPVFHAGSLAAQKRAAVEAYEQTAAQYRATVLQAFGEVADVLQALAADAERLKERVAAAMAAHEAFELVQTRYQAGAIAYGDWLEADQTYRLARLDVIQAQTARLTDTTALFYALGGGWNRDNTPETNTTIPAPETADTN